MDSKTFDWRAIQKYFNPNAMNDLNEFLERMPQTVGQAALIAAGIAWMSAGAVGLFTAVQVGKMTELRAELKETEALKPAVPILKNVPVPRQSLESFTASLGASYPGLAIKQQGANIQISAKSTALFGAFREAVSHVQNGGSDWRVSVDKMCVGRECKGDSLRILLKISKVSVDKPKG